MNKWYRPHALTLDEIRTIGFMFGLGVVGFWVVTAVVMAIFRPDVPPPAPNIGIVGIVASLVLQQAFKKDNTNGDTSSTKQPDSDGVPPVVVRPTLEPDERPPTVHHDRNDRVVHRRPLLGGSQFAS